VSRPGNGAQAVKILEITSYPPPRAGWGVRVSFLRTDLLSKGHDCQVLNIGKSRKTPGPDYVDVQSAWDYLRKVAAHLRRGYMVHTHINGDGNLGWWLALAAELMAKLWRRPCVVTFHAGPKQRLFPRSRSGVWVPFFRVIFRLARVIICNSAPVKDGIREYGVPDAKIHVIPAFSRQYLEYERASLGSELDTFLKAHRPCLAVYFFLRPEFYIPSFLEAVGRLARSLPELGVVAVGLDTRSPEFAAMLKEAGIEDRVFCAGDLDHDRFLTVLSEADFYVRTPPKDGVCSSVLEALSLRTPVIASANGHRPDSVITFEADSAQSLTAEVEAAWERVAEVTAAVIQPEVEDTVEVEVALLLAVAQGQTPESAR
jgi:glycosyltransferase involved in cell wall biosynthesis